MRYQFVWNMALCHWLFGSRSFVTIWWLHLQESHLRSVKMRLICSLETSGTKHPMTQCVTTQKKWHLGL